MDIGDVEDFLNGSSIEAEAPVEVETPTPEPEAPAQQPRDEAGRFAPKGDTADTPQQSASPAPENKPEPSLDHPALIGERRRRQEAEARLAELEARYAQPATPAQPQFQPQTTAQQIPDRWEDPEGYDRWLIDNAVTTAEQRAIAAAEQRFMQRHLDISEAAARERHADFDDKLAVFKDLVAANPTLARKMTAHPDPAGFAYTTAAKAMEVEQYGTIDQLVAAKVAEALAAHQAAQPPAAPVPTVPTTLADAQSAKVTSPAPQGPPSLADILGRK